MPISYIATYVQHSYIQGIEFKLQLYIVPTITVFIVNYFLSKFKKAQDLKDQKIFEKELLVAQQIHHTQFYINKFIHNFRTNLLKLNLNFEQAIETTDAESINILKEKQKANIKNTTDNLEQLQEIIVSKSTEVEEINLKDIIQEVEQIILSMAKNRVKMQIELYNYKPLEAIPSQIHQLLLNLCCNSLLSLDNKSDGLIKIDINSSEDNQSAVIDLIDNRNKNTDIVFNNNSQAITSSVLDLSFCQKVIEGHKGKIKTTKDELGNFNFHLTLPYKFQGQVD